MSNFAYVIAHAAIAAVFKYHAEITEFRTKVVSNKFGPWCKELYDFHIVTYNNVIISPTNLSVEFLQQFNLFELRDILTLYTIVVPCSWSYDFYYSSHPHKTFERNFTTNASSFSHSTTITTALNYIKGLITDLGAGDASELKNNIDLIKRNNELTLELKTLKKQLEIIKESFK